MTQLIYDTNVKQDYKILLWISKDYYLNQEIEYIQSLLGNNESIAQVVNDIMECFYKDCLALWYSVDDKEATFAYVIRKEEGGNQ